MGTSPQKIKVVFNGVEPLKKLTAAEKSLVREQFGVKEGDFVCVILARLELVKGHKYILEMAKILAERGETDIKILIAGTGALEDELKRETPVNAQFLGFVRETERLLNIVDVQLNASIGTEATSLSLLEGMSIGVPAVVSDFGGNPYVIEDGKNGCVVPQRDAAAMAAKIIELKNDRALYNRYSSNAEKIFQEKFTAQKMTAEIENIYKSVAKEGNNGT